MKIGDKVRTLAGDRINGPFGEGVIIKLTTWSSLPSAIVKTEDGKSRHCLRHNLIPSRMYKRLLTWREEV